MMTEDDPFKKKIIVCLTNIQKTEKIMWSKNLLIKDLCIPITIATVHSGASHCQNRKRVVRACFGL